MKLYAISDNHGKLDFKVPPCDLLLHAGDVCPDYAPGSSWGSSMQEQWLSSKWLNWRDEQPIKIVMGTFGNHDFISRYSKVPPNFNIDHLLVLDGPCTCGDEGKKGPHGDSCCKGNIKVWFSPWSNTFGGWAWMKDPMYLEEIYDHIPDNVDIIVSHQPPYGYGDQVPERYRFSAADLENDGHVGSKELLATIDRVKPKAVVCGHIHSGFGSYDHNGTKIYNVSLVNESYERVNPPTEIIL